MSKKSIHNDSQALRLLPKVAEKELVTYPNFEAELKLSFDRTSVAINIPEIMATAWKASSGVNRQFTVIGSKDGSVKEETLVGRVALPSSSQYRIIVGAALPVAALRLTPAVAALASTLKDRSYTAALTAAQTLFQSGSSTARFTPSAQASVRKLLNTVPDPTRFLFKLAQMWTYAAYVETEKLDPVFVGTVSQPVCVQTVEQVTTVLASAKAGAHFAFLSGEQFAGDFTNVLSVLAAAASNVEIAPGQRAALPSILTSSLAMPDIVVAFTGEHDGTPVMNVGFSSYDIWEAAFCWATLNNCADRLHHCINLVVGCLFSTKMGCDEIFSVEALTLALPPLEMSHYALFPLQMAVSDLPELDIPEPLELLPAAAGLVLRNQGLSVALGALLSRVHIGTKERSQRLTRQANRWLSRVFSGRGGHPTNIWTSLQAAIADFSLPVEVGLLSARLAPAQGSASNLSNFWLNPMLRCTQWEEMLDVVDEVPACSIAHMLTPCKSTELLQPGHYYKLAVVGSEWLTRAAYAIHSIGGAVYTASRELGKLQVNIQRVTLLSGYRGVLHDCAIPVQHVRENVELQTVFQIPDYAAAIKLHAGEQAKAGMKWYLSGASEETLDVMEQFRLAAAVSDLRVKESLGSTSALGNAETLEAAEAVKPRNLANKPVFVPEPTEKEKLDGLKKRVPKQIRILVESIQQDAAEGNIKDLADTLLKCAASDERSPGYSVVNWCRTFFGNLKEQLSGISVTEAVRPCPMKSRSRLAGGIARMFRQLIRYTDFEENRRTLSEFAARADNLSASMAACPALTKAELIKIGYSEEEAASADMDDLACTAVEYGLPLSQFLTTIEERVLHKVFSDDGIVQLQCARDGWLVDARQIGLQPGEVKMVKKVTKKIEGTDMMALFDDNLTDTLRDKTDIIFAQQMAMLGVDEGDNVKNSSNVHPEPRAIDEALASNENDGLIGVEGSPSVAALRADALEGANEDKDENTVQDFRELLSISGGGSLSPSAPAAGTETAVVVASEEKFPVSVLGRALKNISERKVSFDVESLKSAAFEDVESKQ